MAIATATVHAGSARGLAAIANGVVVSTLYWSQAGVGAAAETFGNSHWCRLLPAMTLIGYAAGVALQAGLVRDLTSRAGLLHHLVLLALGLGLAASAPEATSAAAACLLVGIGCSLTQRLLAITAASLPADERAGGIGRLIACGLAGVVCARAFVPGLMAEFGWRSMFAADALLCTVLGVIALAVFPEVQTRLRRAATPPPSAVLLWWRHAVLRRAALAQMICFAVFNAGWALYPRFSAAHGLSASAPACVIASLGAVAALGAGAACRRFGARAVALQGAAAVLLGLIGAPLAGLLVASSIVLMLVIEVGTQFALVANHACVQTIDCPAEHRGRMAAIVTTVAFAGGAIGAALANSLP